MLIELIAAHAVFEMLELDSRASPKALDSLYITIRLLEDCRNIGMSFSNELYTFTLQQIVTNYIRIHSFKNDDLIAAFSIMAKLIDDYFSASQFTCLDADSLMGWLKKKARLSRWRRLENRTKNCIRS